jgi:hypothetical protein
MVVIVGLAMPLACASSVFAADPLADACATAPDSATCQSRGNPDTNPLTGTNGTLYRVATIIAVVAGLVAVIVIMVSGFRYVTSGGDAQKTASARSALIGAIVGLVIIVLAQSIITIIVRSLQ